MKIMKKTISILMSLIIAICMMPFAVFADDAPSTAPNTKTYGPEEPMIENIEAEVIDAYDISGANALFYDNPVFEDTFAVGMDSYEVENPGAFRIPVRPKMNCDLDFKITTDYTGNLYYGAWTATKEGDTFKAVKLAENTGKGPATLSVKQVNINTKIIIVLSVCGDYIPGTTGKQPLM